MKRLLLIAAFFFGSFESGDAVLLHIKEHVTGPFGGQESTEELIVHHDGAYIYTVEETNFFSDQKEDGQKRKKREFSGRLSEDDLAGLRYFLDSREVGKLPSTAKQLSTIDFFWDIDVELSALGKSKTIRVRTFQPWADKGFRVYPRAFVELVCKIDAIKQMAKNTSTEPDSDWCVDLLGPTARRLSQPKEAATTK